MAMRGLGAPGGPNLQNSIMASEIRRLDDDKVVAVGGNAIRDGGRYLIAILLPIAGYQLDESDIGAMFLVRDGAMFLGTGARLELTALPAGDLEMAEFRLLDSNESDPAIHDVA